MDILDDLFELFVVASVAALAPMISALIPKIPVPQVVILILGGIVIGPVGLGLEDSEALSLIANVGLGFVFLLAGFEIEPALLMSRPGRLALIGWLVSAVAACVTVGALAAVGYVHAFVPVALALTTTALGTVLPILREHHMSGGTFGRMFMAVGAIGELFPILAIAIFLGVNSRLSALISIAAIGLIAVTLAGAQRLLRGGRLESIVSSAAEATGQTTLRLSILLLLGLLVLAGEFGLDVVLGAFLAGVVLRRWAPGDTDTLANKLDAVGYGFFIPVFFVSAGMDVDVDSIIESPARLLVFLALLLSRPRTLCAGHLPQGPRHAGAHTAHAVHRHLAPADRRADPDRARERHDAAGERCRPRRCRCPVGSSLPTHCGAAEAARSRRRAPGR